MRRRAATERAEREQVFNEEVARAAAAAERTAAAQEAMAQSRPDLRIHALAYAVQSFSGHSPNATTSDIALRAEAFFLFLTDRGAGE